MSVTFGISLAGHAELLRKLASLEARVSGDVARKTLGVGCTPVLQEMRKTVPIGKTRNLRNSLGKKIKQYRGGVTIGVVGPRIPQGAHAHLIESGTVERKQKKSGRRTGRVIGTKWMERAFNVALPVSSSRMIVYLAARLRKLGY